MDRPRQITRVIDHMLSTWDGHASIDPTSIGMFGFSVGGFTTLVSIGGIPDLSKVAPMCRKYPADFACQLIAKSNGNNVASPKTPTAPLADPRIKAAVVAAPALGFAFSPDGLKDVKVPIQLWRAENDVLVPHPRYAEAVRLALPLTPDYRVVEKAGHFDFLAPCSNALSSLAPAICVSAGRFDRAAFHAAFNVAVVTFLQQQLVAAPRTDGSPPSGGQRERPKQWNLVGGVRYVGMASDGTPPTVRMAAATSASAQPTGQRQGQLGVGSRRSPQAQGAVRDQGAAAPAVSCGSTHDDRRGRLLAGTVT